MMRSKKYNSACYLLFIIAFGLAFAGCSSFTDASKKYVNGNEIVYTAKSDSISALPGKNKLLLNIKKPADPNAKRVKVVYNNGQDTLKDKFQEGKKFVQFNIENLSEGTHTFHINTSDNDGHKSLEQEVTARIYGKSYQESLLNRLPNSVVLNTDDGTVTINWDNASKGMIATKVKYTNTSNEKDSLFVSSDSSKTTLTDLNSTSFKYKSLYLPEPTAIDTFQTKYLNAQVNKVGLPNSTHPIQHAAWDGDRWGDLAKWSVNAAVKAPQAPYGGYDGLHGDGNFTIQGYGGDKPVKNGKIYQTITLPAGKYKFSADFTVGEEHSIHLKGGSAWIVVAKGDDLPNASNVNTALGSSIFVDKTSKISTTFTLSKSNQVTVGFLADYTKQHAYFRCGEVSLKIIN